MEHVAVAPTAAQASTARPRTRRAWLVGTALVAAVGCGGDGTDESSTHEEPGTGGEPTSGGEAEGTAELERTGGEAPAADAGPASPAAPAEPDRGGVIALYGVAPPPGD